MINENVLSYDPFSGDFGDAADRVLKNKIGTARKVGACCNCDESILPGSTIRMLSGVFDGELISMRWCTACCEAMSIANIDDGHAMEVRYALSFQPK